MIRANIWSADATTTTTPQYVLSAMQAKVPEFLQQRSPIVAMLARILVRVYLLQFV
jgi:hypothetical protein